MQTWYYITSVRFSAASGQTTHVVESCRALAARRATTLFAPVPPPAPLPGLAVQLVPVPDHAPRELIFQGRLARAIMRHASRHRPDVLYVRAAAFNLGAILAARRLGIPCILELNGLPALEYTLERAANRRSPSARARGWIYTLIAHLEGRLASGIVAVTPQLAAEARRWGARHIYVATNGTNPAEIIPQDRLAARRALGLPDVAEIAGFVGNFARWQGLETLVRAALLLRSQRPELRLLLIGDGVERGRLEALAAPLGDRVCFTGALPHQAVGAALSACDILAAPFPASERNRRTGVSPLKVFEYLALGRPVLASALPGLEFIERERLGMLCAPDDPAALAQRLTALLDLPAAERAIIGARARAAAESRYSWDNITAGLIAFAEGL
jgi:glycosyltransferase involved in cell wall biosynthesis